MRSTLIILFLLGVQLMMAQTTFISHGEELAVGDDVLYGTFIEPEKTSGTVIVFIAGSLAFAGVPIARLNLDQSPQYSRSGHQQTHCSLI